ncbi:MAG: hypothetical protein J6W76_07235, partial [Spirochaetales bacterium]|nr:hypothetical protein [Spirochaetales bacterium]
NLAFGIDNQKVTPYRPQDAKSISREVTFQADTDNYELLKDILLLLALCVQNRAEHYGLHGSGVTLKLTYHDMKSITRSRSILAECDAVRIYQESVSLLDGVDKRLVRLIGVGIYNLTPEQDRMKTLDDYIAEDKSQENVLGGLLDALQKRYGLDFAGHLEQIYHGETLHKTVEYMRKHFI